MSEMLKTLINVRLLRKFSRELTLEQLEEALDKLTVVVLERREYEKAERAALAEKEAKLEKVAKQIAQNGIDVEALLDALAGQSASKNKRGKRPEKYCYIDNGKEKTWTGQGRTPSAIQVQLDAGKSIDDFLIQK
ncbi:H-NS family nucleoid-associated regulatory protein [Vibrio owensii]|uniref:H-NS family histone-like protein n=1 Tax=Vibrio owensii TaxID=696485 RepID=UPI0022DCEFDC|nr:H-NS family nucleoid-associated regulatory protein [Vibrio owensii]MDA0382934.1 H-NS family nucleoid-associated regulatory protein [Vibrio owensii]